MPAWLVRLILLVVTSSAKPIGKLLIHFLQDKAKNTKTVVDDYALQILDAIVEADTYTLQSVLTTTLTALEKTVKDTTNEFDDVALEVVRNTFKATGVLK